ncbi:LSU ribosomal protein L9P [Rubritalea squalenifaciens DSM 18772]|uniref:Large ribosomal subunit protein bL9 n=2 Tax=Rubritalea TaxID=361050 RepID=A0A1M6HZR2_9BACT|nr:50S ribosomal protein L9 [Rubritalea squalenifaciens]SHJ27615.1 LSU ribosomal protein L9P [Rubritalea squalenifaciens DSM 18772]
MATTEVILRTKIDNLGAEADVVKVKAGYARNFLIPQGKAFEATEENLKHTEELKAARAEREAAELTDAQATAAKIKKFKPSFTLEIGQGGKAFGSVTSIDIHKKLEEAGIVIDRKSIQLESPIKTSGESTVEIKLHSDVSANLVITIESGEEA